MILVVFGFGSGVKQKGPDFLGLPVFFGKPGGAKRGAFR
jgi:hypothetical protein